MKNARPLGLLVVLFTAACGASPLSLNPTAPSAFGVANIASGAAGGTSSSTVGIAEAMHKPDDKGRPDDRGKPDDNGKSEPAPVPPAGPVTPTTEIEGLIADISGTSITVNGHVVVVPAGAVIRHGSRTVAFADLRVGDRVHVKARLQGTSLEASEVKVQNSGHGDDDGEDDDDDDDDDAASAASVRVTLLDATASEAGTDTGVFRLVRTASATLPLTAPLTVTFTLTGTATNGTDYATVPLTATFLAGQASVDVTVAPVADSLAEVSETVVLTLTSVTPYAPGAPSTATVTITDGAVPVVSAALR